MDSDYINRVRKLCNDAYDYAGVKLGEVEEMAFVKEGEDINVTNDDVEAVKEVASNLLDYPVKGWQIDTLCAMQQRRNVITLA